MAKCEKCHFEYRKNGACWCTDTGAPSFINDIPEHYNRGLGMHISGGRQYKEELKKRGLVQVGNEKNYVTPEYGEKMAEKKREQEYIKLRQPAYEILRRYEGVPAWN